MREILLNHYSGYHTLAEAAMDWRLWLTLLVGIVVSTTVHEAAHAWTADKLGDPTPRSTGRVSLNPLRHFDAVGAILMAVAIWVGLPVGWGKTVPIDVEKLRAPKRVSLALVAVAGPASNLCAAVAVAIMLRLFLFSGYATTNEWTMLALSTMIITIGINVSQFVFNLIPVHPMDGCTILSTIMPEAIGNFFLAFMQKWGTIVMLGLVYTHVLDAVLMPFIITIFRFLIGI